MIHVDLEPDDDRQTGLLVAPRGWPQEVWPNDGKHFSLDELQEAVGGYVEVVPLPRRALNPGADVVMIVNEDGLRLQLAPNDMASVLAERPIVGTVVVCPRSMVP